MKQIHNITISVFSKEEEDYNKIKQTFLELIHVEDEKLKLTEQTAIGFGEKKIKILEMHLIKQKHITEFMKHLLENLTKEQKQLLRKQKESRLDDKLFFFIRLDKNKLLHNQFQITDEGNCFHIKILIAAFPKKRETALNIVEQLLKQ